MVLLFIPIKNNCSLATMWTTHLRIQPAATAVAAENDLNVDAAADAHGCCAAATSSTTVPEGTPVVMPGDSFTATFTLPTPVAMDTGLGFAILRARAPAAGPRNAFLMLTCCCNHCAMAGDGVNTTLCHTVCVCTPPGVFSTFCMSPWAFLSHTLRSTVQC
jgi:hypothetical protein